MKNRKTKKGFTLTELIIIVAVVGILATIVVASFLHVSDKATLKSDQNTVAALNGALDSAAAVKKDLSDIKKVLDCLRSAGYTGDRLKPEYLGEGKDDKFCFIWDKSEEAILMINLKDNTVMLPEEYEETLNDEGDWFFLTPDGTEPADDSSLSDEVNYNNKIEYYRMPSAIFLAKQHFNNTLQEWETNDEGKLRDSYVFVAKIYLEYEYEGVTYPIAENDSSRGVRVYATYNGDSYGTGTYPLGDFVVVQYINDYLYNTNEGNTQASVIKYCPVGGSGEESILGLYAYMDPSKPAQNPAHPESIFGIYKLLDESLQINGDATALYGW